MPYRKPLWKIERAYFSEAVFKIEVGAGQALWRHCSQTLIVGLCHHAGMKVGVAPGVRRACAYVKQINMRLARVGQVENSYLTSKSYLRPIVCFVNGSSFS